jgi:hypothetical protein
MIVFSPCAIGADLCFVMFVLPVAGVANIELDGIDCQTCSRAPSQAPATSANTIASVAMPSLDCESGRVYTLR